MLLVDPISWRGVQATGNWIALVKSSESLGFQYHDQCIINYMLAGRVGYFPSEYNYLIRNMDGRLIRNPRIAHFSGWEKPWRQSIYELWFKSHESHRDLYRQYSLRQLKLIVRVLISNPRLSAQLLNIRRRQIQKPSAFQTILGKVKVLVDRIIRMVKRKIIQLFQI